MSFKLPYSNQTNWGGLVLVGPTAAPAVVPDPYFEYTTLLLPGNGTNGAQNNTFLDGSTNNFTITRNGNTTQGTFSPFSQTGWGNYFDGSGDYLSIADNAAFNLNGTSFCLEGWVYPTSLSGYQTVISKRSAVWEFGTNNSNLYFYNGTVYAGSIALQTNTWTHVAVTNDGTNLRMFVNGVVDQTLPGVGAGSGASSITIGFATAGFPQYWPGYISNLRVVKGSPVYTTAFTPPTAPLTAISGTSLLTCQSNRFIDNSTNNFTITRNGDTRVVAFSPFNPTASWSAATNGGSGYFDGSGDYLNFTDSANNLDLGGVQASVDFWFYRTSAGTDFDVFLIKRGPGAGWSATDGIEYLLGINSNQVVIYYNTGGGFLSWSTGVTITPFQWNHLCVATNTSNNISVFLNGTTKATSTFSIAKPTTRTTVNIGVDSTTDANYLIGYMSGLRFLTGSNAFDPTASSITVPTAPPTVVTGTQLLLNYTNAGVYDATSKNDLETVGDAQISTAQSKWGGSSMLFDGATDYLVEPTSVYFGYGTGNFTIEFWLYLNVTAVQTVFSNLSGTASTNPHIYMNSSTLIYYTTGATRITGSTLSTGIWYHIAVCRASGSTRMFIDGIQTGSTYADTNDYGQSAPLGVGTYWNGGAPFTASTLNGYLQDVRVTKGIARYTANFTPPTAAFPTL